MKLFKYLYELFRPMLGIRNVCIFPITCSNYAEYMLEHRALPIALVLIAFRLLRCNPITVLIWRLQGK